MLIDLPASEIGEPLELDGENGGRPIDREALEGAHQLAAVAAGQVEQMVRAHTLYKQI